MAGVVKQIIGSFEDIGKDVARETIDVPKDIAGKALESLGTSSSKVQQGSPVIPAKGSEKKPEGALGELTQTKDQKVRQAIARDALSQIAGVGKQQKEPTVQERLAKEEKEKREKEAKQLNTAKKMAPLAPVSTKAKRGNLYGVKQKASSEMSKNVRQD